MNQRHQSKPFRFSLQVFGAANRDELVDLARRAEDLGFSSLVTIDHLLECWSPLPPLITVAENTSLRVGIMVLNNDFRHPALLAREAATIDLLTDGRLELGLGAGHGWPEYERIGLAFDPPPVRVSRLEESVVILRRLLAGEAVDFHGAYYDINGETTYPRPVQAPVPLLIGGGGKRVLGIAARHADIVGFAGTGRTLADGARHEPTGFPAAAVDGHVEWVRGAAGDRIDQLEFQALVQAVVVTGSPRETAANILSRYPDLAQLSVDDLLETPYLMIGTTDHLVDKLREQRARWGITHYTVRPDALDQLGPVISALV